MISQFRSSKKMHLLTVGVMFMIMFIFNALTQLLADDFAYYFSFATDEPISGFKDSIDSIIAHGEYVNGRYFAHYLAQMCLLLPPVAFDLINSAVFVATIYIVYIICNRDKKTDNLFLIAIFGCVWLFEQDFGQTNLWLDGSCNYLFAIFFGLIFIIPFINSVLLDKKISPWLILPHILLSFWFGGYLEMTSVGFVGAACLFIAVDVFYFKKLRSLLFIPSIIASFLGLALMVFAPAQASNKMTEFSFVNLLSTLGVALLMIASIFPIIIIYCVFFKRAGQEGADKRVLITSVILVLGALASNFVLVIAKYYALRCSISFIFMSIFATALLYGNLENKSFGIKAKKLYLLFTVALSLALVIGLVDNIITYSVIEEHEAIIEEALSNGEREVELCRPVPFTKYNGLWGLRYLDIRDPDGWPNNFFAKYYGLDRVYGTSVFGDLFGGW